MTDWTKATTNERITRRDELTATGSMFADQCGADSLPCGICDECAEQGVLNNTP